jgi:hypothetical protein
MGWWQCVGWWLLSALGGLLIAVGQPSRPVLAVGAFEGNDEALVQQARQQVVQTLSLSSRLRITDREHARAILQEQRLRETGLTGESEANAAPLPAAQWLLVGRIVAHGERLQIELSSLDVRTGALLTGGMETVSGLQSDWKMLAQRAAERMHRRLTGHSLPVGFAIEPLPDEGVPPSENRRDYAQSPYHAQIEAILAQGWMRLYPDGMFRPSEPVSACYFAALLQRLQAHLGAHVAYEPSEPARPISCGQAAVLLAKISEARLPNRRASYLDIPDWAKGVVGQGSARAVPLTREQLAALLYAMLQAVEGAQPTAQGGAP